MKTAALTPGSDKMREVELPTILSLSDAARYRRIFNLQQASKWAEADKEIAALSDHVLVSVVQAQRYLSPKYRASYAELRNWLAENGDEPDAHTIYALALNRQSKGAPAPARPPAAFYAANTGNEVDSARPTTAEIQPTRDLSPADKHRAQALTDEIRNLGRSAPRRAEILLASADAKRLLDQNAIDELRTTISDGYLANGDASGALTLSAASKSAKYAPLAHWQAGLAAWRLGKLDEALKHFQALARSSNQSNWTISEAAFWAARVELRSRRPELFNYWLGIAAEHPRTFYGLLARKTLGVDTYFDFEVDAFTDLDAQILTGVPAGRRALALLQVGETEQAEAELRTLAPRSSTNLLESLVALADRANMPALSLEIAGLMADSDNRHHDHALYPVPRWAPQGGFTVDRALLFGLMRQESEFLPVAHNQSGATGLMQLMPATARSMAEHAGVDLQPRDRKALSDPSINLALAQQYIGELLDDNRVRGNLLYLAAAYNAGPTALPRFQTTPGAKQDPLMFIESIPNHETRVFVQRVLTNYWIYRQRLGQPTPDLDALAAGEWPTYVALDKESNLKLRNAQN